MSEAIQVQPSASASADEAGKPCASIGRSPSHEIDSLLGWDVDIGQLPELRERLRRRPEYGAAAQRLASDLLSESASDPVLSSMLRDAGRTVAALTAIGLHTSGGVTLTRFKSSMAGFGLVSPGRVRAFLSLMLHLGYLERDTADAGRLVTYRATPQFLESYTRHEVTLLEAVRMVEPAVDFVRRNLADPVVLHALVTEQVKAFSTGSPQAAEFATWYRVFMHPLGGRQILHSLVAEAKSFPPAESIRFSAAAAARRFKVSRIHVTRIMKEAAREGFVELAPGDLQFTAAGQQALDWLYANRLCVQLISVARTLKAVPRLLD